MAKPAALSTQQLKERGWSPAMIRDLLGQHDRERPNELRVGRSNRAVNAPVKLYLEARVVEAEATERFAVYQDRARDRQASADRGQETKAARQAAQLAQHAAVPLPVLTPHPDAATLTQHELWTHHYHLHAHDEYKHADLLAGLPSRLRREASATWYRRYRAAVYALYGWPDEAMS